MNNYRVFNTLVDMNNEYKDTFIYYLYDYNHEKI